MNWHRLVLRLDRLFRVADATCVRVTKPIDRCLLDITEYALRIGGHVLVVVLAAWQHCVDLARLKSKEKP